MKTRMRKVISRVVPEYPELARTIRLSGSVKLEVLVLSNGRVKSVHVKGGNAVLVQSAENAVREWQWQKSNRDTTELVEIRFSP
jgi:TonB family protein